MIADLKPYPRYRDSSLPWLGEIPEHWRVQRLKNWVVINRNTLGEATPPDFEFDYLDIGAVSTGRLTKRPSRLRFSDAPSRARRLVQTGDTIVSTVRTYLKAVYTVGDTPTSLVASTGFAVLSPRADTSPSCLGFVAQSEAFTRQVTAESVGIAYPAISETRLGNIAVTLPPPAEQAAIVRFLDWANGRLERTIRAKRKVMALLGEQKQAIIHRAVTRGLDPAVPLKPSGIPWLGEIPAHWEVRRLRHVCEMLVSNVDKLIEPGELPVRLCNYVDVYRNERIVESTRFMVASATRDEVRRFRLRLGDVIITKDSEQWNDIGVPALVAYEADDLVCGYHLAILRPRPELSGEYLLRALQAPLVATQFHVEANGVTRYALSQGAILGTAIPIPSMVEQVAIANHVEKATLEITNAISRLEQEITLLREYRTRLVADLVTGKLDVREAAARLPDDAPLDATEDDTEDDTDLTDEPELTDEEAEE